MTEAVIEQVRRSGLVAIIRSQAGLDTLLEVGDALLASPLPVLAISTRSREPGTTIAELRARFGRNMVIGAAHYAGAAQPGTSGANSLALALDAGAQFILGGCFHAETLQRCQASGSTYVPRANDGAAVSQAVTAGCPAVTVFPARHGGLALCRMLAAGTAKLPVQPAVIAVGGISAEAVPAYARSGIAAVGIYGVLGSGAAWRMPDLIRRVRRLRSAWWANVEAGAPQWGDDQPR